MTGLEQLLLRYMFAFIGATLAMGLHLFMAYPSWPIFHLQRIGISVSNALLFACVVASLVVMVSELPALYKTRWSVGQRVMWACLWGLLLGVGAYATHHLFTLYRDNISPTLLLGGVGLSFGFVVSNFFKAPRLFWIFLTTVAIAVPIWSVPILFFNISSDTYRLMEIFIFSALIASGGFFPIETLFNRLTR
ncbi:hypothetical protein MASR2M15_19780 [Anaerolineales bacterium]